MNPNAAPCKRSRESIQRVVPDAEQGIAYGVPTFRLEGKAVAGFAAFKNHLAYLPHSGSVFPELRDELADYVTARPSGARDHPGAPPAGPPRETP